MKRPFIIFMRNLMLKAQWLLASLVLGLALAPTLAEAIQIGPGGAGSPDTFSLGYSSDGGRTVVATANTTWNAGSFTGGLYMQVESDPGNVYCSGCLDFISQFANDSSSTQNVTSVALNGYRGYQTDVGYDVISVGSGNLCGPDDNGFCNSGSPNTVPTNVYRSSGFGDTVGFYFPGVVPSDSTVDLVIMTNARSYIDSTITVYGSNGGLATLPGFGPAAVPEPETYAMVLAGLGLLGFTAWRRKNLAA